MPSLNHIFLCFVTNTTRKAKLLSVLCFVVFASSCKKERFNDNNTGKELFSDDELLGLSLIDTVTLDAKIVTSDSLRTDEISSTVLLGSYVDPVFGKSSAEIFTQVSLDGGSVTFPDISKVVIDSLYLQLPLTDYYGTLEAQTFEVYRLSENIVKDNDYYSTQGIANAATNYVKSGFETIVPNSADSVTVDGENKTPMLYIRLDESLANDIMTAGSTALGSDAGFVDWFKGFHIKVNNPSQASGEGAILSINIQDVEAKMVLYYTDNTDAGNPNSEKYAFKLGTEIAYFNKFTHDYTGTAIEAQLNDPSLGNNEFFIQAMAGVNTEIDFPHLKKLSEVKNIVINKAILELPINSSTSTNYENPSSTFVLGFYNDGETVFLPDQFLGSIGGTLGSDATYTFNITSFVNKIISGEWTNPKLRIGPIGGSVTANRAVFYGVNSSSAKPVLKLYYSTY